MSRRERTFTVELSGGTLHLSVCLDPGWAGKASDEEWEFVTGLTSRVLDYQRMQRRRAELRELP